MVYSEIRAPPTRLVRLAVRAHTLNLIHPRLPIARCASLLGVILGASLGPPPSAFKDKAHGPSRGGPAARLACAPTGAPRIRRVRGLAAAGAAIHQEGYRAGNEALYLRASGGRSP